MQTLHKDKRQLEDILYVSSSCVTEDDVQGKRIPRRLNIPYPDSLDFKNFEYRKLRSEYNEISDLPKDYEENTNCLKPSKNILVIIDEMIESLQSLYKDSDECYLSLMPNGNIRLRFTYGDLSCALSVGEDGFNLIILDYIDEVLVDEFPQDTPMQELVDIMKKNWNERKDITTAS